MVKWQMLQSQDMFQQHRENLEIIGLPLTFNEIRQRQFDAQFTKLRFDLHFPYAGNTQ